MAQFKKILKKQIKDPIFLIEPVSKKLKFINNAGKTIKESKVSDLNLIDFLKVLVSENSTNSVSIEKYKEIEIEVIMNNTTFYYVYTSQEFYWEGKEENIMFIMKNITIHKLYSKNLEENSEFKDLMLSTVSHDLRTPLNCSITMTKLCIDQTNDNYIRKNLTYSLKSSQLLLSIVNDLLDFSQINAKKFKICENSFKNDELICDVKSLFELLISEKNLNFIIENNVDENELIYSDKDRIERILVNLISNSLKFTTQGFIKITSDKLETGDIQYSVEDSGIGIKEDDKSKLFKLYGKVENKETNGYNQHGIGLGLTISNMIACCLNNKSTDQIFLNLESDYGKGTKFWFAVPQKIRNEINLETNLNEMNEIQGFHKIQTKTKKILSLSENGLKKFKKLERIPKLLIIEDEETNLFAIKTILEMFGYQMDFCYNGKQAQDLIINAHQNNLYYPIIISDINMPVMNGFQFARWLRVFQFEEHIDEIKLIACSANVSNKDQMLYEEAGFDSFIEKPINFKKLENLFKEK